MNFRSNKFYTYPLWVQWLGASALLVCFFLCCTGAVALISHNPLWALLTPLLIPISQFAVSPLFTLIGLYQYLSPTLLIYLPTKRSIELHHATSFDYLFLHQQQQQGVGLKKQILFYYVEGLLNLIRLIEAGSISPTVIIEATTYFLNRRTTRLLGFSRHKPGKIKRLCLCLNFFDLLWMYSFTTTKLRLPPLGDLSYLKGEGYQLLENKEKLIRLHMALKASGSTLAVATERNMAEEAVQNSAFSLPLTQIPDQANYFGNSAKAGTASAS